MRRAAKMANIQVVAIMVGLALAMVAIHGDSARMSFSHRSSSFGLPLSPPSSHFCSSSQSRPSSFSKTQIRTLASFVPLSGVSPCRQPSESNYKLRRSRHFRNRQRRYSESDVMKFIENKRNNHFDCILHALANQKDANDHDDDNEDPYSKFTHQIAIPLHDVAELHSALHSIQTSLVRDCPRLIRACIMPALLRLPLLYVNVEKSSRGGATNNGNFFNSNGMNRENRDVDDILCGVVHRAIREVVYGETEEHMKSSTKLEQADSGESDDVPLEIAKPILLPFRGLELQGMDNSVLYAVGYDKERSKSTNNFDDDDGVYIVDDWDSPSSSPKSTSSGWSTLETLVVTIQKELEDEYGWETRWPLDDPHGAEAAYDEDGNAKSMERQWRPRVPFVRLPTDFYDALENDLRKKQQENKEDGDIHFSFDVEKGYDGISPLFWYEAWGNRDILPSPGARMRSVAIYRRAIPGGGEAESSFYIPTTIHDSTDINEVGDYGRKTTINLPQGDGKTMARERREKAKAMERMGDVERRAEREWEEGKARWMEDLFENRNQNDETRSFSEDKLYSQKDTDEITVKGDAAYTSPWSERTAANQDSVDSSLQPDTILPPQVPQNNDDAFSQAPHESATKARHDLPNIEDNPIFQRLWKGQPQLDSEGRSTAQSLDGTSPSPMADTPDMPPYPSDEHFVGIWRVVSSPLTSSEEDATLSSSPLSSACDNFIFRVDGTIMGGPILDSQHGQKAAGGTWNMFQAVRKSSVDAGTIGSSAEDESRSPVKQTRLRIRLLIPPKKDQAVIMEGEVTRLVMPGVEDASSSGSESQTDGWKMGSGGMLDGMNIGMFDSLVPQGTGSNRDAFLCCGGEAWVEDASGGGNRRKLGSFSLMKLKTPDRNKLIYTVPASRGGGPHGDDKNHDDFDE